MKKVDNIKKKKGNVSRKAASLGKNIFVQIHINLNLFSFRRHKECNK